MEIKYCWRCKMEIPMLTDEEYSVAHELFLKGARTFEKDRQKRFKKLLDYYSNLTGFVETEPNAIMHHAISMFGPDCENCGRPYRTPRAKLCASCGNKRSTNE